MSSKRIVAMNISSMRSKSQVLCTFKLNRIQLFFSSRKSENNTICRGTDKNCVASLIQDNYSALIFYKTVLKRFGCCSCRSKQFLSYWFNVQKGNYDALRKELWRRTRSSWSTRAKYPITDKKPTFNFALLNLKYCLGKMLPVSSIVRTTRVPTLCASRNA